MIFLEQGHSDGHMITVAVHEPGCYHDGFPIILIVPSQMMYILLDIFVGNIWLSISPHVIHHGKEQVDTMVFIKLLCWFQDGSTFAVRHNGDWRAVELPYMFQHHLGQLLGPHCLCTWNEMRHMCQPMNHYQYSVKSVWQWMSCDQIIGGVRWGTLKSNKACR